MVFQPNTYSVLLVSASKKLNQALSSFLSPGEYEPVVTAGSIGEAKRILIWCWSILLCRTTPE